MPQIDYINEGRNADRFRRNFRNEPWVKVPRVHWQRTSASVLTMEYVPGIKITDITSIQAAGLDAKAVAQRTTESYLIQILKHGFFHADPHPGNIAIGEKPKQVAKSHIYNSNASLLSFPGWHPRYFT